MKISKNELYYKQGIGERFNYDNKMLKYIIGRGNTYFQQFAKVKQFKHRTSHLIKIDSIELDNMCDEFMHKYGITQDKQILTNTQGKQQILDHLKWLFHTTSSAKIGFLRGDIHAQSIYKINKFMETKQPEEELGAEDYKDLLQLITQSKDFRIPLKGIINRDIQDKNNLYQRQLVLENVSNEHSFQKFYDILDSLINLQKVHMSEVMRKPMVQWFKPFCKALKDQQIKCRQQELSGKRKLYAPYFLKMNVEKLGSVCLSELLRYISGLLFKNKSDQSVQYQEFDGITQSSLISNLSKWVNVQCAYQEEEKKFKMVMKIYESRKEEKQKKEKEKEKEKNEGKQAVSVGQNNLGIQIPPKQMEKEEEDKSSHKLGYRYVKPEDRKRYLEQLKKELIKKSYLIKNKIPEQVQFYIGEMLVYLMKEILKVPNKYGFQTYLLTKEHKFSKKNNEVKSHSILKVNEHFLKSILPKIQKQGSLILHLQRSLPTMIEPLPWIDYEIGGYYLQSTVVMRFSNSKLQERLIKYSDLSRVYNVLNNLGKVSWKINKKVLQVVQGIWTQGGQQGQIPKRYSEMISTYVTKMKFEKDPAKQRKLQKQIQRLRDQHSLRCDFNFKLSIARSFSKLDKIYFPHNLDFRGRVYPVPPHLNHIGNDLSRGLLCFSEGKKLGQSGLKWLKIHTANLMGKDKATIPQKLDFLEGNLDLIKMIAQDPISNRQWLSFEDCWQSLSSIIQLNDALKSKNPEEFVSHLHIHQDGSCNGLQHYAALGRDMEGAYQVNLGPTERPGDVYTHVAKMVIKMIEQDINDETSKFNELAKLLHSNIKRKTIKQTVMTSVYGVTFIGARQQIHRQLKDQNFLQENKCYEGSHYLAVLTLKAISNLFERAHLIKKWLIKCAKLVAETNNPVGWITPMGLPVVQPYRTKSQLDVIQTIIQNLKLPSNSQFLPVNKSKQQSAFPPNYVHSLDSTHMMYTSEECVKKGITFAAVHDSYWTHASTIEDMNTILRQQFIKLHSQPLLQNLKNSLQRRYPEIEFPEIPQRGQFDLEKIKESQYFFS